MKIAISISTTMSLYSITYDSVPLTYYVRIMSLDSSLFLMDDFINLHEQKVAVLQGFVGCVELCVEHACQFVSVRRALGLRSTSW